MRFGLADVATLSYTTAPDGLRVRALNPSPPGVFSFELGGFLPLPRGLDGLVEDLRPDGELARRSFGPGACLADRGGTTDHGIETDAHDGVAGDIPARSPCDAGLPLGTVRLVGLPIDHERLEVITLSGPPLVAIGAKGWAHDIDLMVGLSGDQEFGIHIAAVEQVRSGEEITQSGVVAGVVLTWVIRCGWPSSQVSVRCTL